MTYKVAYKLTRKHKNIQEKAGEVMGGQVIDLPEFRIYDEGIAEGKLKGAEEHLIKQICRKLRKNKSFDQITEELEEDKKHIEEICLTASKYGPEYDEDTVIKAVLHKTKEN